MRGKGSELIKPTHHCCACVIFNNCRTLCTYMGVFECMGACSDIRMLQVGGVPPCLLTASESEDHAVAHGAKALVILLLFRGHTH